MVKAQDLINAQKERENIKYKTFAKIYQNVEKKIKLASSTNYYQVYYEIPEFVIGFPLYDFKECKKNIIKQLIKNGFEIDEHSSNIILIKWIPK
jgi:hypothetical protein